MWSCRCQEFLVWSPGSGRDVATFEHDSGYIGGDAAAVLDQGGRCQGGRWAQYFY